MFPEYHVCYRALNAKELPIIHAGASGSVELLRALVPQPGAPGREEKLAALQAARFTDPEPCAEDITVPEDADYSATDLAAAGNHTEFLAAWAELVGPFRLASAFDSAIYWLADRSVAWMLANAAHLQDADLGNAWHPTLSDVRLAKKHLGFLASQEAPNHIPDPAFSREACLSCFCSFADLLFAKFEGYPTLEDQFNDQGTAFLTIGRWTIYKGVKELRHGPTAQTWRAFFCPIEDWFDTHLAARFFVRLLGDFFPSDPATRLQILSWVRPHALVFWKSPEVFRLLLDNDLVRLDASLLASCLNTGALPDLLYLEYCGCYEGRRDLFLSLRLILSRLAARLGGAGAGSNDLAAMLEAVQDSASSVYRRRSYVLLLLFFGAGGRGRLLEKTLEDAGEDRYPGLMDTWSRSRGGSGGSRTGPSAGFRPSWRRRSCSKHGSRCCGEDRPRTPMPSIVQ